MNINNKIKEEDVLHNLKKQGIIFNEYDSDDEEEFHQPFEHYDEKNNKDNI